MRKLLTTAALCCALAAPAAADEFTDVVEGALEAYRDGDIDIAREEMDYAMKLLREMESQSLAGFLPAPLEGWQREDADGDAAAMGMAMFGGGTTAMAEYTNGSDDLSITLVANSPMVAGIGAMVSSMASLGKPMRIQRVQFAVNDDQLQGVVDNRILVTVDGSASLDDKKAFVETMDLRALGDF